MVSRGVIGNMLGRKRRTAKIDSLIGQSTEIKGDVCFNGGLHVDGKIIGNVFATEPGSLLTLSDQGSVEGEVRVPNVMLNGQVKGDVYANERIELASRARVMGNVYYNMLEMTMGAEVNGKLVHEPEMGKKPKLKSVPKEVSVEPVKVSNS